MMFTQARPLDFSGVQQIAERISDMVFSSNIFLFFLFPIALLGHYLLHKPYRNCFLLLVSLLFFAWGEPDFIFFLIGSIVFNYGIALLIDRACSRKKLRKLFLIVGLSGNLALLFVYKYLNFFVSNLIRIGFDIPMTQIVLPIGISFFTFQAISYIIDVYRGDVPVQRKLHHIGLYISFFPQLIAGPIVRYQTIANQIENRETRFDDISEGVYRFIAGFSKKILLANNLAVIADAVFGMPDPERSVFYAWLGAIAYSFQIYYDFSGYSDMAIGLGKMFGFHFLENFNYPYIAKSITDFWQRWHISLGRWFRDYVYIPLGGSRVNSKWRLVWNLFVVWILTGAWHGAYWNFVCWGLLYFVLIVFEKLTGYPARFQRRPPKIMYRVFSMLCVLFGWVLFRAEGFQAAVRYGMSMLGLLRNTLYCDNAKMMIREYWLFLLVSILCATESFKKIKNWLDCRKSKILRVFVNGITAAFYAFCFYWSLSNVFIGAHNPFIYFNF